MVTWRNVTREQQCLDPIAGRVGLRISLDLAGRQLPGVDFHAGGEVALQLGTAGEVVVRGKTGYLL